jgi:hypothetical protein
MSLEDRYSNLGSRPWNIANRSTITNDSVLASRPQEVKNKSSITSDSTLAFKPVEVKVKPLGASTLVARPQNPTEKLSKGIVGRNSLFAAVVPRNSSFYIATSQTSGPSPAPAPTPTPTPGIGAFSTAYSNAYDGTSISAFSAAFSNAF